MDSTAYVIGAFGEAVMPGLPLANSQL